MKTSLELAIELEDLLKRSKPFRNFQSVFTLTEQLIFSLTPNESLSPTLTDLPEIEEEVFTNLTEEETTQLMSETKSPIKNTPNKPKPKK